MVVLQRRATRMEYVDPGASSYETRYRARVIDGAAITTGANAGRGSTGLLVDPLRFGRAGLARSPAARAFRRHSYRCHRVSPHRCATSDTTAPGSRLSRTMRALSAFDHRRRRSPPTGHLGPDASHRSDGSVLIARKLMRGVESHRLALICVAA